MSNILSLQYLPSSIFSCITDYEEMISSGSKSQSSIILIVKEFCLIGLLLLCFYSFLEDSRVALSEYLKNLAEEMSSIPFRNLKLCIRSPHYRQYTNVTKLFSSSLIT